MEHGRDRISNLPDNIREHILQFLPLPDAAKSSLLSSKWYNLWINLPILVFDAKIYRTSREEDINAVNKLMFKLCRVLFLHPGPLKQVTISLPILRNFPEHVDQIVLFLHNKVIQGLTVNMEGYSPLLNYYKLPRRLFSPSFSKLETLRLSCCQLTSTTVSFEGFSKLTVIELRDVEFQNCSTRWSFSCPLLSALTLVNCGSFVIQPDIVIDAPKLSFFHFDVKFRSLHFLKPPALKHVCIRRIWHHGQFMTCDSNFLEFLVETEYLSVSHHFCTYLAHHQFDMMPWKKLRCLSFDQVRLISQSHASSVIRTIVNSPNLQQLTIQMEMEGISNKLLTILGRRIEGDVENMIESHEHHHGRMMKRVEVKRVKGTTHEMGLIQWLLKSSPALDKMEIWLETELSDAEKVLIMKELNGFQRISGKARIIIN